MVGGMNVLLVSQCNKNALQQSRRILDQFAERRGERTWQTSITRQGLDTLRGLLRKTARKNTAVACHWIHGVDHSELLWVVGDSSAFNSQGAVPTNTTQSNVLRRQDENDWHSAEVIHLLAAMAALFHDQGKANLAFQNKLASNKPMADALRHEWVSLRLFEAFVGKQTDRQWLEQLAEVPETLNMDWFKRLEIQKDSQEQPILPSPFKSLPPLAKAVGWLIVSHHRLPTDPKTNNRDNLPSPKKLDCLPENMCAHWCGARLSSTTPEAIADCWRFDQPPPIVGQAWQSRVKRWARRLLERANLLDKVWLDDPYVMHMARLVLMLADHHYSSLIDPRRWEKVAAIAPPYANTCRVAGLIHFNQPLDEHLLGVEKQCGGIVRALPQLARQLPRITRHKGFKQRTRDTRFQWQDKAYDLAGTLRQHTQSHGFFGVNMASTGFGKTLANGRILYALADPICGARFSIALGLRTLTLQTGDAYRQRLGLGSDDLAILVGGTAVRELHEHNQQQLSAEKPTIADICGSASAESLLPDNSYVHFDGSLEPGPLADWLAHTRGAGSLLNAPVLVCTIDHLMPATEGVRGGQQIIPMLRLMSADLVLDEPDDFGTEDLPALTRLVHWAGLLGSRVLLSSATLPPALVQGLFNAYREGRTHYQRNRGVPGLPVQIVCAWFDEHDRTSENCADADSFAKKHVQWVDKRIQKLRQDEARRQACIIPVTRTVGTSDAEFYRTLAEQFQTLAHELHHKHHSVDPESGKRVSFGLIRMANIDPLIDVTRAMAALGAPMNHRLYLCCYHSHHPLLVRSNMEHRLDQWLNRQQTDEIFFQKPMLRVLLNSHPEPDQLFIVLASPVAEVGRDHDYDWAVVEPSSMRSIIQLAGRVRRHRSGACQTPNIYLLEKNLKGLSDPVGKNPAFCHPGFEQDLFKLNSHSLADLLTAEQWASITAIPRIAERADWQPRNNLADLEHECLRALMLDQPSGKLFPVCHSWHRRAHLSGELQRASPFRYDPRGRILYAFLFDDDTQRMVFSRIERDGQPTDTSHLLKELSFELGSGLSFWGETDYVRLLERLAAERAMNPAECARRFGTLELPEKGTEQGWAYHPALGLRRSL